MADIKLLATDLDGTLIGSANEFPLYSDFRDKVLEMQDSNSMIWVACTGRKMSSFKRFFSPMRMMGIKPAYVILNHAYIYGLTRFGYVPHVFWNIMIKYRLWAGQIHVRAAIDEWHDMITSVALGVSTVRRRKNRLCLRFDSEESATVAADLLKEKVGPYKHLKVFKYLMEVDVRSVPFTKGLALSELSAHLGISSENILAIGNGHNDISMLDGGAAKLVGCPSNAEPEVMEEVSKTGGHIASNRCLAGVLEIIEAYNENKVNSELPEDWQNPSQAYKIKQRRPASRNKRTNRRALAIITFTGVGYVVLLIFANFGLVPYVSGLIIKPFKILMRLFEEIILLF